MATTYYGQTLEGDKPERVKKDDGSTVYVYRGYAVSKAKDFDSWQIVNISSGDELWSQWTLASCLSFIDEHYRNNKTEKLDTPEDIFNKLGGSQFIRNTESYNVRTECDELTVCLKRNISKTTTMAIKPVGVNKYDVSFYSVSVSRKNNTFKKTNLQTYKGIPLEKIKDCFYFVTNIKC